ncbi:MAG TPA: DUF167 family protein [Stellaceae bacterium]|nr:DUF167 family protein [Stellaceae bacterium]
MPRPFAAAADGVRLSVWLSPRASAERIDGIIEDGAGGVALKVAVTAPPEAGKANAALLALLARVLKLKRRDLTLALGAADRRKLVHVAGDPAALAARLEERLGPWLKPE